MSFDHAFESLTGYAPFPWQRLLHERFVRGEFPPCSLPTGLGKTSVMAVWLLALAATSAHRPLRGGVPRRLAYVVNRRTIVDQATREAEKFAELIAAHNDEARVAVLRKQRSASAEPYFSEQSRWIGELRELLLALAGEGADGATPLAISTLRGQFADNGEWSADPARPAIIIGTVDMIGSRLLFSGYGRGFKSRPLHAGFLGQDTLLVHDEAHLEPAFQHLLDTIRREQTEGRCADFRPLHVMTLTATPRRQGETLELSDEERNPPDRIPDPPTLPIHVIWRRLKAKKTIQLHQLEDEKKTAETVAALAIKRAQSRPGSAILVFVRKVEDVKKAVDAIGRAKGIDRDKQIGQLTGTLRGKERDELVRTAVFQRFLPASNRDGAIIPAAGTVFLVCTSAGEVGVDISADHLVCDLTTFDSMAQRFGRVNRYGDGDAKVDVVHLKDDGFRKDNAYDDRRKLTLSLLKDLRGDGSPKAIGDLPLDARADAFSPMPKILDATDILFDAWALTTIREKMPGRPRVADWLHGVPTEWQPPETRVAWRSEVQWITGNLLKEYEPADLLEVYPIKPHELLNDRSKRVFEELEKIAKRLGGNGGSGVEVPLWLEDDHGVEGTTLQQLIESDEDTIADRTVILPPFVGGLSGGMLDGKAPSADDVADEWFDENGRRRRKREWDTDEAPPGMRAVRSAIDLAPDADESDEAEPVDYQKEAAEEEEVKWAGELLHRPGRVWRWYALPRSADDDGSRTGGKPVLLTIHAGDVKANVVRMATALDLAETSEGRSLVLAAQWHDLGKNRGAWQRSIWNAKYPGLVLAKTGNRRAPRDLSTYRHEFGSLLDVLSPLMADEWEKVIEEERELVLHFIAAHHGRARPHFPTDEAFDAKHPSVRAAGLAREVPRRFARLQRKYGRWGLAYLESILRAADAAASVKPSETVKEDAREAVDAMPTEGAL